MLDYSWIPFFEELSDKLIEYKNNRKDLIFLIKNSFSQTSKVMPELIDDIDPFTIFSILNYSGTDVNKKSFLFKKIKNNFHMETKEPTGFDGVPQSRNVNPYFY